MFYVLNVDNLEKVGWAIDTTGGNGLNAISGTKEGCKVRMIFAPSEDGGSNMIMANDCS
jgi:hypothetical protein